MSGPTRGMVAGQAITTQAQTKEFDEGYERIFGKAHRPARGSFVWSEEAGAMVERGADWAGTDSAELRGFTDLYMEGDRTAAPTRTSASASDPRVASRGARLPAVAGHALVRVLPRAADALGALLVAQFERRVDTRAFG